MNKFTIFTICTRNYEDVIDLTVPTWSSKDSVDRIYLYTDFNYTTEDPKVEVINILDETEDWLKIVGFKSLVLSHFIKNKITENFAFIDIDCILLKDVSEVFNHEFDVAATRMNKKKSANSGVWFCKNSEGLINFSQQWDELQKKFLKQKKGVKPYHQSYSQLSFSEILHKNKNIKVLPIDENVYNCEHDTVDGWLKKIDKYNPKIIHLKGRRWRDKNCMNLLKNKKILN